MAEKLIKGTIDELGPSTGDVKGRVYSYVQIDGKRYRKIAASSEFESALTPGNKPHVLIRKGALAVPRHIAGMVTEKGVVLDKRGIIIGYSLYLFITFYIIGAFLAVVASAFLFDTYGWGVTKAIFAGFLVVGLALELPALLGVQKTLKQSEYLKP